MNEKAELTRTVNEHFEFIFNAGLASVIVFNKLLGSSRLTCATTRRQYRFNFAVRTGNDVCGNQAVTDPLAGVGAGTHRGVHRTGFAAN
jgi:hypothetical protein